MRAVLLAGFGFLALIGIAPIVNATLSFLGFYAHPEPMAALAEIFPPPLPKDIQPIEAYRYNSSDYWSLYVAMKTPPGDVETLRALRGLAVMTGGNDPTFKLPTSLRPPAFWPRENCPDLVVYESNGETFKELPSPGTWQNIRLFYCPRDQEAFVWSVDVN